MRADRGHEQSSLQDIMQLRPKNMKPYTQQQKLGALFKIIWNLMLTMRCTLDLTETQGCARWLELRLKSSIEDDEAVMQSSLPDKHGCVSTQWQRNVAPETDDFNATSSFNLMRVASMGYTRWLAGRGWQAGLTIL